MPDGFEQVSFTFRQCLGPAKTLTKSQGEIFLCSTEILNAHKCKNIKKFSFFFQAQISLECFFPGHKC